jgi:hypothetical protein
MATVPVEIDPAEIKRQALLRLLKDLAGEGYDIRAASGHNIETGGVFVFAVDDDDDPSRPTKIAAFLNRKGYRDVRVVEPFHKEVGDHVGALADAVEEATRDGQSVQEILVGLPKEKGDPVEIQITTLRSVS